MHSVNRQLFAKKELMLSKTRMVCGTSLGNLCTGICYSSGTVGIQCFWETHSKARNRSDIHSITEKWSTAVERESPGLELEMLWLLFLTS